MRILAMSLCLLLSACESTSFQAAPFAEAQCDPALNGNWRPVDDQTGRADDVELQIDSRCQILFTETKNGEHRDGKPVTAHIGNDGDNHYLWVDAAWVVTRFDLKQTLPAGDVFVVRYRIENGQLVLQSTDNRTIAHRIIDGKFPGEVRRIDGDLRNRMLAPIDVAVLREPGFFAKEETRLRREPAGSAP